MAYLRSVFLQPDRKVFDVAALPAAQFALSLGLPTAPQLRFLDRAARKAAKAAAAAPGTATWDAVADRANEGLRSSYEGAHEAGRTEGSGACSSEGLVAAGAARGIAGRAASKLASPAADVRAASGAPAGSVLMEGGQAAAEEDDFLVVKRRNVLGVGANGAVGGGPHDESGDMDLLCSKEPLSASEAAAAAAPEDAAPAAGPELKRKKKKLRIQPGRASGRRVVFDEDGAVLPPLAQLAVVTYVSACVLSHFPSSQAGCNAICNLLAWSGSLIGTCI